jgi:hypothetical protein
LQKALDWRFGTEARIRKTSKIEVFQSLEREPICNFHFSILILQFPLETDYLLDAGVRTVMDAIQRSFSRTLLSAGAAAAFVFLSTLGLSIEPSNRTLSPTSSAHSLARRAAIPDSKHGRRVPILGADETCFSDPYPLIQAWQDKEKAALMVAAFKAAGLRSLRLGFQDLYSPVSSTESEKLRVASKFENDFPWFPFSDYAAFIGAHDFTTVVAINVEEGPDVARSVVEDFKRAGAMAKLVAIELSNEPHLSERPWLPEDYAERAADIIESLTPEGVRFGLPLTVGREKKTPTRLSDDEWNSRMLHTLSRRIDLRTRMDIFGVIHLYARGVAPRAVKLFDRAVHPFAPNMRYLVTEFNIRSNLTGNPHLTNAYAMEFARRLAAMMAEPEIEAMYVHSVPFHAILYWADGKRLATVVGRSDPKLAGEDMSYGWHLTPAGKVYSLYGELAWNGVVIEYHESGDAAYWAVESAEGQVVITMVNSKGGDVSRRIKIAGADIRVNAPGKSIVCYDLQGHELRRLSLAP